MDEVSVLDLGHDQGPRKAKVKQPFLKRGQGVQRRLNAYKYRQHQHSSSADEQQTKEGEWEMAGDGRGSGRDQQAIGESSSSQRGLPRPSYKQPAAHQRLPATAARCADGGQLDYGDAEECELHSDFLVLLPQGGTLLSVRLWV